MDECTEGTDSCHYNAIATTLKGVIPALVTLETGSVFLFVFHFLFFIPVKRSTSWMYQSSLFTRTFLNSQSSWRDIMVIDFKRYRQIPRLFSSQWKVVWAWDYWNGGKVWELVGNEVIFDGCLNHTFNINQITFLLNYFLTYEAQSLKNSCPHSVTIQPSLMPSLFFTCVRKISWAQNYHSAMLIQPATDRTWQVPLGYFFAEYHTGWNRLYSATYHNLILAVLLSDFLLTTLTEPSWLYSCIGWNSLLNHDRWSLFQSAFLLGSFCFIDDSVAIRNNWGKRERAPH